MIDHSSNHKGKWITQNFHLRDELLHLTFQEMKVVLVIEVGLFD